MGTYREIECGELSRRLASGEATYLVDVRQPWEHALAALPHSVLVPLDQLAARRDEVAPPPGALLVTYCHHGVRSLHAAAFLAQAGFDDVCSLAGGIDAWSCEIDPALPRY